MNIVWAALVVIAATAVAVAAMLAVRRRAPEGSYFSDSDRAAGIFGVLATGFSVLLGFLIFLGFESYDASRSGAETEALTVAQQIQTAQFLPAEIGADLTGELVCYARRSSTASGNKWRTARSARTSIRGALRMFSTLQDVELGTPNRRRPTRSGWTRRRPARRRARTASTVPRA